MSIKFHFFGKDCIVDRAIADREDLKRALRDKGFEFDAIQFVNQVHSWREGFENWSAIVFRRSIKFVSHCIS